MSDERQILLAVNQAFYRAFEKRDLDAMSAVWSQGTGSLCVHPGRDALKGWDKIFASWQQIFKHTKYLEIDTDIVRAEVSGNLGYVVLIENLLQVGNDQKLEAQSMATNVFERMAEKWYLIHHHGSPILR